MVNQRLQKALQIILTVAMGIAIVVGLFLGRNLTFEQIVNFSPKDPYLAALFMIVLYSIKSLSVFFPVIILFLATGSMFELPVAITVTMLGLLAGAYTAYAVGAVSSDKGEMIQAKFPKLKKFINANPSREKFMNFFLRIVGLLPSDAVSMYLGAVKMPLWDFTWTTFIGHAPNALVVTILGASIKDTSSFGFYISLSLTVLLTLGSTVFYYFYDKKERRKHES